MESAPMNLNICFEDGKIIICGVSTAPSNEAAIAANQLFKDQDADQNQNVDITFGFSPE